MAQDKGILDELGDQLKDTLEDKLDPKKVFSEQNLKKKRGAFFTCLIAAFLLVLLAAVGAVYVNAIQVDRFETALLENVDYASLGTDELSIRSFARETIFYLTDAKEAWEPQIVIGGFPASSFIPQTFRDHMATVKGWVSSATAVFLAGAAIVLLLLLRSLIGGNKGSGDKRGFSLGGYYLGMGIPLVLLVGVGLWAYLDFDGMWGMLHKLFIPDGIFGSTELVMQLFPETLFAAYLPAIVRSFGLFAAIIAVLPLLLKPLSLLLVKLTASQSSAKRSTPKRTTRRSSKRASKRSTGASR